MCVLGLSWLCPQYNVLREPEDQVFPLDAKIADLEKLRESKIFRDVTKAS